LDKTDFDEVVDASAKHFISLMDLKGWLGVTLERKGFDVKAISQEQVQTIIAKVIIQLYDTYEEDIEYEENQDEDDESASNEEQLESDEIDEEEKEDVESEEEDRQKENEEDGDQ
jgi:hypothetical protein